VMIPTLSTRRDSCVKVHIYSQNPRGALSRAAELGRRLRDEHDALRVFPGYRVTWFSALTSPPKP
jgi:hypothetical protein